MEKSTLLDGPQRKILGHSVKDWVTLAFLTAVTIVLIVILSVVLPSAGGVHPCKNTAESIILRVGKEEGSKVYERTKFIAETFGARKDGYPSLEQAVDWIIAEMKRDNLTATKQAVNVPRWTRGAESANLVLPTGVQSQLRIIGLVGSVGANKLSGSIIVVQSFADLAGKDVQNKIVVFDQPWDVNGTAFDVVKNGAVEAAKVGAIACLVRSPTPFSLSTLHVGVVQYQSGVTKIPVASITVEDAAYLSSLYAARNDVQVHLNMDTQSYLDATSYNIIAELEGASDTKKEEFVVIGSHLDTLDLGHGVQDSLAGFVMAWEGIRIMKSYNMVPARSIRLLGWTGTELGHLGAQEYADAHNVDTVFAFDANRGPSEIQGLYLTTFGEEGTSLFQGIADVLGIIAEAGDITLVERQPTSDIDALIVQGVPGASFQTLEENDKFYWFSNSDSDRIESITPEQLREGGGVMAAYAYCVADADENIPKRGD